MIVHSIYAKQNAISNRLTENILKSEELKKTKQKKGIRELQKYQKIYRAIKMPINSSVESPIASK